MPHTSLPAQPAWDLPEPAGTRVGIRSGLPPVVRVCGEIDAQSAPQLRDDLLLVLRQHGPRLELDLRDVTFLDCAGVNVLLATRRRARLEDGWVRVIQASSRARQTILLLGLAEVLGLGHARQQAAGSGKGQPAVKDSPSPACFALGGLSYCLLTG